MAVDVNALGGEMILDDEYHRLTLADESCRQAGSPHCDHGAWNDGQDFISALIRRYHLPKVLGWAGHLGNVGSGGRDADR